MTAQAPPWPQLVGDGAVPWGSPAREMQAAVEMAAWPAPVVERWSVRTRLAIMIALGASSWGVVAFGIETISMLTSR